MSDSCGRWRGPSIIDLLNDNKHDKIQLLVHPGLWMEERGIKLKERIFYIVEKRSDLLFKELSDTVNDDKRKIYLT